MILSASWRYPLYGVIGISVVLLALTYRWEDLKPYLEAFGLAWVMSWVVFVGVAYMMVVHAPVPQK